jgi:hypothetical protein
MMCFHVHRQQRALQQLPTLGPSPLILPSAPGGPAPTIAVRSSVQPLHASGSSFHANPFGGSANPSASGDGSATSPATASDATAAVSASAATSSVGAAAPFLYPMPMVTQAYQLQQYQQTLSWQQQMLLHRSQQLKQNPLDTANKGQNNLLDSSWGTIQQHSSVNLPPPPQHVGLPELEPSGTSGAQSQGNEPEGSGPTATKPAAPQNLLPAPSHSFVVQGEVKQEKAIPAGSITNHIAPAAQASLHSSSHSVPAAMAPSLHATHDQ